MYNKLLDTYICVVDSGSFNKASELLFISSGAVIKQINLLESHIGIKLLNRTPRGIKTTAAGQSIYESAKEIIYISERALEKAKSADKETTIRVGLIGAISEEFILGEWQELKKCCPNINFNIVTYPLEDATLNYLSEKMIDEIDCSFSVYGKYMFEYKDLEDNMVLKLEDRNIACFIPPNHVKSNLKEITMDELKGETVVIMEDRQNYMWRDFMNIVSSKYPEINIISISRYSYKVFEECIEKNRILLLSNYYKSIHPFLYAIPLKCDFTIPFGFFYQKKHDKVIDKIISVLKDIYDLS